MTGNVVPNQSVKIRATHEVMTARATELALFIMQFVAATGAPAPVFAASIARLNVADICGVVFNG